MSEKDPTDVPKILIAILTTYERQGWPCKDLADWLANLRCNANYAWQHTFCHNFIPAAGARNTVAKNFKDCGADWILMLDNDMSPPPNLLDTIQGAPKDAAVIVPKFYLWDETNRTVKLCWGIDEDKQETATVHGKKLMAVRNKFYELNKCGTGAIFIKPEVFQKVPHPWFWYRYDPDHNMIATEDIVFANSVREHGFKIYGNGGITVGHHHTVNLAVLASCFYDLHKEEDSCAVSTNDAASASVDGEASLPISHQDHGEPARPAGESSLSRPAASPAA
jgi:hypothetical protein